MIGRRVLHPDAIWQGENYLVTKTNKFGDEVIVQSELTPERAERSVEILNDHEKSNARRESYSWRRRIPGEVENGRRQY